MDYTRVCIKVAKTRLAVCLVCHSWSRSPYLYQYVRGGCLSLVFSIVRELAIAARSATHTRNLLHILLHHLKEEIAGTKKVFRVYCQGV
jgi:hypothetical protein